MRWMVLACLAVSTTAAAGPTFRWAATPTACVDHGARYVVATENSCLHAATPQQLVVAYPPSTTDPRVPVIRYDGDHAGAPQGWLVYVDAGPVLAEPVVLVAGAVAYVVLVKRDAVLIEKLAVHNGARLLESQIAVAGAQRAQLAISMGDPLQLDVLAADGGHAFTLDATLRPTDKSDVPASAIRMTMDRTAISADGKVKDDAWEATWDEADLVVRWLTGKWSTTLVADDRNRTLLVTLHALKTQVIATVHDPGATGTTVYALAAATGAIRWQRTLTGIGPIAHSRYANDVASFIAGDTLVVQGVESAGNYICTVALADGRELACVDHLDPTAIVMPTRPIYRVNGLPREESVGPVTTKLTCVPSRSSVESLTFTTGSGMTTGKHPKPITWIDGTLVAASVTCQPSLGGGAFGDRVELTVFDNKQIAAAPCACTFEFRTPTTKDTRTVIVHSRGKELARKPLPAM